MQGVHSTVFSKVAPPKEGRLMALDDQTLNTDGAIDSATMEYRICRRTRAGKVHKGKSLGPMEGEGVPDVLGRTIHLRPRREGQI